MDEETSRAELKRRLVQASRLMKLAGDNVTRERLAEMVRELERIVEAGGANVDPGSSNQR